MYNNTQKKNMLHRLGAFVLALCMVLSLLPALGGAAEAAYSDSAMDDLLNWGVISGYPDGSLRPERSLTRAEFVAMVNRAYGYKETGPTPFTDVPEGSWYHDDIGIAYNANYFTGVSQTTAAPNSTLTREQAVVLLGRNMRLDQAAGEVTEFSDGRDFGQWSRGYARAAAQAGIIGGYPDGSFKPKSDITRGDMAVMLKRALGTLINQPGTHTLSDTYGNVTISSPNTTLKDTTIAGDLYITGGLALGDIMLENVRVLGDIIVAGGGESQSGESVILRNVEADSLKVDSIAKQYVSLAAEGNTAIEDVSVRSNAYIQDRTRPGEGFMTINLESANPNAQFTLSGNLETVVNKTPNSLLTIAMGTVDSLQIDEKAVNSTLNLDVNSTAMKLNLDTAANVIGVGDIADLYVNAPGSTIEMLPDTITIRPGLIADIAGEPMDAKQAQESSSDPRLLAGYPKVKNIAPTSATAVFAGNKSGTVYWAVSTTTDGSIGEEELVEPTKDNTRIFLNGTTPLESADLEYTAALDKLDPDTNYYLSTVMLDARGRHSPVKVASFTTPDDTVPAFTTGYPVISQNDFEYVRYKDGALELDENGDPKVIFRAQVAGMANKNCQIYFALYPAGSAAPTGQQFRTGNLGKPVHSGVEDITKNTVWLHTFKNLDELTEYDLYLWLTDADGARSSDVKKLTFKTVDGTPPKFQYETPLVSGNPPATSIPARVNMNENATVYWAVVKHGEDFIKADIDDKSVNTLTKILELLKDDALHGKAKALDTLKRKIESGSGSLRNGSSRATADTDLNINMGGLTAESAYDVYFVAKDEAGNFSDVKVLENVHTLDTTPPSVTQAFSHVNEKEEPYADTDIDLIFNEDIQHYPTTFVREKDENGNYVMDGDKYVYAKTDDGSLIPETLVTLKDSPKELGEFLDSILDFYNDSGITPTDPIRSREYNEDGTLKDQEAEWYVDYRKATVKQDPDTGEVVVTLATKNGALNLRSGATYHFAVKDVQDLATTPNRIRPMPYLIDRFQTIRAQVQLRKDVTDETISFDGQDVEVDMSFSLRPISVNVEDTVPWEMLFWSDSTVMFDIYRRVRGSSDSWQKIPEEKPEAGQMDSLITVSGADSYIAKGLYAHLANAPTPMVVGTGRDNLDPNKVYEYVIHFTKVGDIEEGDDFSGRLKWNKEIEFRINVITAESARAFDRLRSYSSGINYADYTWMRNTQGVEEINTTDPNSDYFTLNKSFSDRSAPTFTDGYPKYEAQDISATIKIKTNREGTVYWVVAPITTDSKPNEYAPYIPPTAVTAGKFTGSPNNTTFENTPHFVAFFTPDDTSLSAGGPVPHTGEDKAPDQPATSNTVSPFLLVEPSISAIYNPSFGHPSVRSGSIQATGVDVQDIEIPNLEPDTPYYLYLVTQTKGQALYSPNVMLYQFWTESVYRPKLRVSLSGTKASVTSYNMDAIADYAIFLMTDLPNDISRPFYEIIDNGTLEAVSSDHGGATEYRGKYFYCTDAAGTTPVLNANGTIKCTDEASSKLKNYLTPTLTVYEALSHMENQGGSLYDDYASTAHKERLRQLMDGTTPSKSHSGMSVGINLKQLTADVKECQEYDVEAGRNYLFIASARSTNGRDANADSYGFAAISPVAIVDNSPPTLAGVEGYAFVNLKSTPEEMGEYTGDDAVKGNTMSGHITLTFQNPVHYYDSNSETNPPFSTEAEDEKDSNGRVTKKGYRYFEDNPRTVNYVDVIGASISGKDNVNQFELEFKNAPIGSENTFIVARNLIGYSTGSNLSESLTLYLTYNSTTGYAQVELRSVRDDWYRESVVRLIPTDIAKPEVSYIYFDSPNLQLDISETRTVKVNFSPVGSSGNIEWRAEGPIVVEANGTTATVRALSTAEDGASGTIYASLQGADPDDANLNITMDVTVKATPKIVLMNGAEDVTGQVIRVAPSSTLNLSAIVSNVPTGYTVVWESTNPDQLDVGFNTGSVRSGTVVGQYATITATVYRNGTAITPALRASCTVEIVAN